LRAALSLAARLLQAKKAPAKGAGAFIGITDAYIRHQVVQILRWTSVQLGDSLQ
jgi:hypothetical protein